MEPFKRVYIYSPASLPRAARAAFDAYLIDLSLNRHNPSAHVAYLDKKAAAEAAAWLEKQSGAILDAADIRKHWKRNLKKRTERERQRRDEIRIDIRDQISEINSPLLARLRTHIEMMKDEMLEAPSWILPTYDETVTLLEMEEYIISNPREALPVFHANGHGRTSPTTTTHTNHTNHAAEND